jgi:large subunit ribosomal protein L32
VQLQPCPNCKRPRRPHTVCPNCGHYGAGSGREVIKVKES